MHNGSKASFLVMAMLLQPGGLNPNGGMRLPFSVKDNPKMCQEKDTTNIT